MRVAQTRIWNITFKKNRNMPLIGNEVMKIYMVMMGIYSLIL